MSTDDMLHKISCFASSGGHGDLAALAVTGVGDQRGNIAITQDDSCCSVQEVIDKFCVPALGDVTKVSKKCLCQLLYLHE